MYKLLIGVLAASLAVAACGSSSKSGSNSGSTTTVSSGSANDLSELASKSKTSAFKVTYKTSNGSTITIAQDGNGKESIVQDGNLYIIDGESVIRCDGTTSTATCRDLGHGGKATTDALTATLSAAYRALETLQSSVFNGQTTSETIAGRDATCVSAKAADMTGIFGAIADRLAPDASFGICVDKATGALLKVSGGTSSSSDILVATEFAEPTDSDFQPPSTPKTVPTIPQLTIPSG
jgi:hypothetical protein